jgi:tubulin-specific chaperone E
MFSGNRFPLAPVELDQANSHRAFGGVKELGIDEIFLSWEDICLLVEAFPNVTTLSANSNELTLLQDSPTILRSIHKFQLTALKLEYNTFTSLGDLSSLSGLHSLERLYLKGNQIKSISHGKGNRSIFGKQLQYVDLSYNDIANWDFVDQLPDVFPGMTALRFSHNPIYEFAMKGEGSAASVEEGYMLTLARIANLKSLNFSHITPAERTNAELFYLYWIGKAMAAVPESQERNIITKHKRFEELCKIYGPPTVVRASSVTNPGFLEARLIKFTFYMPPNIKYSQESEVSRVQEIPKGFDIYQVKGIVGALFGLKPLRLQLIWETGEWDPVARYEGEGGDSSEGEEEDRRLDLDSSQPEAGRGKGMWMRREVELEDGTRQVGFWIDGTEAKVRIELR